MMGICDCEIPITSAPISPQILCAGHHVQPREASIEASFESSRNACVPNSSDCITGSSWLLAHSVGLCGNLTLTEHKQKQMDPRVSDAGAPVSYPCSSTPLICMLKSEQCLSGSLKHDPAAIMCCIMTIIIRLWTAMSCRPCQTSPGCPLSC